ncbi:hypothetical protein ACWC5I_32175, partial [Kitasatospora sp. NPDC001574]
MSFSPGGNQAVAEPMLFGGPVCAQCGTELPPPTGSGRPKKYCTKACSKRAERAREAERVERLKADLKAAESPREETDPLHGLADDPVAAELLGLAEQLARADRLLLLQLDRATREGDAALARQALADVQHSVYAVWQRHRELVDQLRDEHPALLAEAGQPAPGPGESPRGETAAALGTAAEVVVPRRAAEVVPPPAATDQLAPIGSVDGSPRGETVTGQHALGASGEASAHPFVPRGETRPTPQPAAAAPGAPRGETPATASTAAGTAARPVPAATVAHPDDTGLQPDAVLRATADPARRFGLPNRTDDLALTFGPGWTTTSWSAPEAAGVHQLHHRGVRVGWAALLGDGPWGLGGWIAVLHLADGRTEPLLAGLGRPRIHQNWSEALDALRTARLAPPATAARTPDA